MPFAALWLKPTAVHWVTQGTRCKAVQGPAGSNLSVLQVWRWRQALLGDTSAVLHL